MKNTVLQAFCYNVSAVFLIPVAEKPTTWVKMACILWCCAWKFSGPNFCWWLLNPHYLAFLGEAAPVDNKSILRHKCMSVSRYCASWQRCIGGHAPQYIVAFSQTFKGFPPTKTDLVRCLENPLTYHSSLVLRAATNFTAVCQEVLCLPQLLLQLQRVRNSPCTSCVGNQRFWRTDIRVFTHLPHRLRPVCLQGLFLASDRLQMMSQKTLPLGWGGAIWLHRSIFHYSRTLFQIVPWRTLSSPGFNLQKCRPLRRLPYVRPVRLSVLPSALCSS